MRKKKNLEARLEKSSRHLAASPEELRQMLTGKKGPFELEIGCGKGSFITQMAQAHPERTFIACEIEQNVLVMAMEKAEAMGLENIVFLGGDAARLAEYFEKGEIGRIYLNFSDPWPGARNRKKRLTSHEMLDVYLKILAPRGELRFKTDNRPLFLFSVATIPAHGFEIFFKTEDLHSENVENVMTEYESRFAAEGKKIMAVYAALHAERDGV